VFFLAGVSPFPLACTPFSLHFLFSSSQFIPMIVSRSSFLQIARRWPITRIGLLPSFFLLPRDALSPWPFFIDHHPLPKPSPFFTFIPPTDFQETTILHLFVPHRLSPKNYPPLQSFFDSPSIFFLADSKGYFLRPNTFVGSFRLLGFLIADWASIVCFLATRWGVSFSHRPFRVALSTLPSFAVLLFLLDFSSLLCFPRSLFYFLDTPAMETARFFENRRPSFCVLSSMSTY